MTVVRWRRRARLDLASIHAYIADDTVPAADALRAKLTILRLLHSARLWP